MSKDVASKWNSRYKNDFSYNGDKPRQYLVDQMNLIPKNSIVLDIAMGAGGNASYLQKCGMRVIGIDISDYAVRKCKKRTPELMAVIADLTAFPLPLKHFDAILNFYYLQRDLLLKISNYLKPAGLVIVETLTKRMLEIKPEIAKENLLEDGELLSIFFGWNIINYSEGWYPSSTGAKKAIARITARLPIHIED